MNRDLPALPSIAFVASLLLALYVYMHNILAISHTPVSQIVSDHSGKVWALYGDALIRLPIGNTPTTEQTLSLAPLGIQHMVGQVIPLPQGGWVVNTGGQPQSVLDSIKRLLHPTETDNAPDTGSLLKCNAALNDCQPWGDALLTFEQPWGGLALDDGQFLIHDSARHTVHLVTANGEIASTLSGFGLPSQIQHANGKYWVLDTSHNQLVGIHPEANQLTRTGETLYLGDAKGIDERHRFPFFALPDGQDWWILSSNADKTYPGLYRISAAEATRYGFDILDATALYHDGQAIHVADLESQTIKRVNLQNRQSLSIISAGLAQQNQILEDRITTSRYKVWLLIAAILAAGTGLLAFALWKSEPTDDQKKPTFWLSPRHIRIDAPDYPPSDGARTVVWLTPHEPDIQKLNKRRRLINLAMGSVILSLGLFALISYTQASAPESILHLMTGLLILLLAGTIMVNCMISRISTQLTDRQIGLVGEKIILSQKNGPIEEVDPDDTFYTDSKLCLNGYSFTVQTPQFVFMDKENFERHAAALIARGQRVQPLTLYWQALKQGRNRMLWIELALIIIAVLCTLMITRLRVG